MEAVVPKGEDKIPRTRARLPPLNPLRAFEAAARHCSFTLAAAELHVTQGAVSQSVKALEAHLGRALFDRSGSGLHLTPDSAAYARAVTDAFRAITGATGDFTGGRDRSVVTIRAYTSFLTYWLIPRIPGFQIQYPQIEIRFIAANDRVRVDPASVDLRVRYGHGRWSGTESVLLLPDEITPVISPALLAPGGAPYDPVCLAAFTWLHSSQRRADWQDWLEAAGAADVASAFDMVVEELSVVYRLATSGLGVALGNRHYLREELASGRLFEPVAPVLRRDAGYFLIHPGDRALTGAAQAFKQWLCRNRETASVAAAAPSPGS
jgi:DNA-binding transcriptional LysR family regulator